MHTSHALRGALLAALLVTTLGAASAAPKAARFKGQELAGDAKVTLAKAREIALAACKGKITDEELEHEAGGSGLRYTFDIRQGKVTHEVGVDAITADVLENQEEGANPD